MFTVSRNGTPFQPRHKRAIVSVVIGEEYLRVWTAMSRPNWQAYCDRHGYDLICITDHMDASERGLGRSPAWQKCLILDQPWSGAYDRIVWVDADIIISSIAPDICASAPDPAMVGVCVSGDQMSEADKHIYFERLHKMTIDPDKVMVAWGYHEGNRLAQDGIPAEGVPMLNTGVMVLTPALHNQVFLDTYAMEGASRLYEQPHLSHELFKRGLIHKISPRFNWIVQEIMVLHFPNSSLATDDAELEVIVNHMRKELGKAYFLHFAGCMNLLRYIYGLMETSGDVLGVGATRQPQGLGRSLSA